MKKKQTAKYKRRKKKELANRKAKQLVGTDNLKDGKRAESDTPTLRTSPPVAEPISPARRAFQDV